MYHNKKIIVRLFLVLFTLSISVAVIPCGLVIVQGLFGEARSAVVTEDKQAAREEISLLSIRHRNIKGANPYNIWFEITAIILYLTYISYTVEFPREETIADLKVRMDN